MPATVLTEQAIEQSTFVIDASFFDENGNACRPNSLTWSLTTGAGEIVNERDAVVITPAETVAVVLSGSDLALLGPMDTGRRYVTFVGEYDSALGAGLHLRSEVEFTVGNTVGA